MIQRKRKKKGKDPVKYSFGKGRGTNIISTKEKKNAK